MNALPNTIILGDWPSKEDAEIAAIKYGFAGPNYYVAELATDHFSPLQEDDK